MTMCQKSEIIAHTQQSFAAYRTCERFALLCRLSGTLLPSSYPANLQLSSKSVRLVNGLKVSGARVPKAPWLLSGTALPDSANLSNPAEQTESNRHNLTCVGDGLDLHCWVAGVGLLNHTLSVVTTSNSRVA